MHRRTRGDSPTPDRGHRDSRIVAHAPDDVVVGLDGPLAFSGLDVPMPEEETSAGGHDLRSVRV